jgi:flagellar assembly factor FliW
VGHPTINEGGPMRIQTSRFGLIELTNEDLIQFPEGILGFGQLRQFVLLDDPNDEIFAWLQSCEEPGIAFPVLEPELFADGYKPTLAKSDISALRLSEEGDHRMFCIVTIPKDPTQMTANLKAPVVINIKERVARQCVLQDNSLAIREPIFLQLQQRVVQGPPQSIKSQALDWGVAVKVPEPSNPSDAEL